MFVSDGRHGARIAEEKRKEERSKSLIVHMLDTLKSLGYTGSLEALQAESGVTLAQYEVADNVELLSVVQEWEDYYEYRFGRRPKLTRKLTKYSPDIEAAGGDRGGAPPKRSSGSVPRRIAATAAPPRARAGSGGGGGGKENGEGAQRGGVDAAAAAAAPAAADASGLAVAGQAHGQQRNAKGGGEAAGDDDPWEHRIRKAGLPPSMAANAELRELASWLQRDMIQDNPNVRWTDIAELDGVKRVLKESLVMPLKFPSFFTGLLQPWKGVLLYGPPGTGKTLLAKAVATECRTTFFNISASSIVSKWRGDSEKLVRVLFELARHHAPSTIFIDEIDALMSARGDAGEHEGSRRMKTELLTQMDGLLSGAEQVFVLAASNLPWELDQALLRRLEKRILVPFPSATARELMMKWLLPKERLAAGVDFGALAARTDGYSGSDLKLVCKEAAMRPLRRLLVQLDTSDGGLARAAETHAHVQPGPVTADDVDDALRSTKASANNLAAKYTAWAEEFGSV